MRDYEEIKSQELIRIRINLEKINETLERIADAVEMDIAIPRTASDFEVHEVPDEPLKGENYG